MFQDCFKGISKKLKRSCKEVSRGFKQKKLQGTFEGVSFKFQGPFKNALNVFHGNLRAFQLRLDVQKTETCAGLHSSSM